eukprot:1083749-Rhodomonas_salina.1
MRRVASSAIVLEHFDALFSPACPGTAKDVASASWHGGHGGAFRVASPTLPRFVFRSFQPTLVLGGKIPVPVSGSYFWAVFSPTGGPEEAAECQCTSSFQVERVSRRTKPSLYREKTVFESLPSPRPAS